jgi:hypothetical protein
MFSALRVTEYVTPFVSPGILIGDIASAGLRAE